MKSRAGGAAGTRSGSKRTLAVVGCSAVVLGLGLACPQAALAAGDKAVQFVTRTRIDQDAGKRVAIEMVAESAGVQGGFRGDVDATIAAAAAGARMVGGLIVGAPGLTGLSDRPTIGPGRYPSVVLVSEIARRKGLVGSKEAEFGSVTASPPRPLGVVAPVHRTLDVGPGQPLKLPSQAAALAKDGDTIAIETGEYFDCAVWRANGLTIIGTGPDVVITDKTCMGKAIFITTGNDITIRNLTLTRARVPDGNGAGIRAEGANLTVEQTRFVNNESGILAGGSPGSTIRIVDSTFDSNGTCAPHCANALQVGEIALLQVERSRIEASRGAHHISSSARRTELIHNKIADGPDGTSSLLVCIPGGKALVMEDNTLEKGSHTSNPKAAVLIGGERGSPPDMELRIVRNRFINNTGRPTVFVLNYSDGEVSLDGNVLEGEVTELSSSGKWAHRGLEFLRDVKDWVRQVGGMVKRRLPF